VELTFTDEALTAIAHQALARKSGARGLRAIIEDIMLDTMYELPSRDDIDSCVVTEEAVLSKAEPTLIESAQPGYQRVKPKKKSTAS